MTRESAGQKWYMQFMSSVQKHDMAVPLREAAQQGSLKKWTEAMTAVVTETCMEMGWRPVAKGYPCDFLPETKQEYLGIDIMAFDGNRDTPWKFPVAVFELENSQRDDRVAYSFWKAMCINSGLRVMICYRKKAEDGLGLVRKITEEVIGSLGIEGRTNLSGETMVVVGTRDETSSFPYSFFKDWYLDANTGKFIR